MEVEVRLFAPYKAAAGREKIFLTFKSNTVTVEDVLEGLQRCYPGLRETLSPSPGRPALCPAAALVGDQLAADGQPVRDGEVIYLVPSIVGG